MKDRMLWGDAVETLREMEEESVHCCVTSPPYWGLRDYGVEGQLGLEKTPEEYVEKMVEVFREVKRVLRKDGTLWLNLGDSYAGSMKDANGDGTWQDRSNCKQGTNKGALNIPPQKAKDIGLKPKDLVGAPWRVAFALQADGWYLRSDIIWHKPNPMPESVRDRPTKAHEYIFLLSKSQKYYFDQDAVREPHADTEYTRERYKYKPSKGVKVDSNLDRNNTGEDFAQNWGNPNGRNIRTVWTISTQPYKEAHFATFPEEIPERCIKAGCPEGGVVLDPFSGSGTTCQVAHCLNRHYVGIEINYDYWILANERVDKPMRVRKVKV